MISDRFAPGLIRVSRWACMVTCTAGLLVACGGDDDDYRPRAATAAVTAANVTGPVPVTVPLGDASHNYPQLATQADLAGNGYVEQEFFFEGQASRYATPALATGSVTSSNHPYKSRMIVRRPAEAAKFNGIVVVEWVNVTSGYNLDALWQSSAAFFMRNGYAYVGVSAQRVGVHQASTGLVSWSPARYGTLDVTAGGTITDDSLSYDIYAQAAKAIASPGAVDPLGGLPRPRVLLAAGVSQSEGRLVTYYNSIEPLHKLFDGYYLFLGLGGKLRTDIDVKALKINTENDVLLLSEGAARQPDSDRLRTWEIAGASHVSYGSTLVRTPLLVRDGLPSSSTTCNKPALSRVSPGPVLNIGYPHLVNWIRDGREPPKAEPITLATVGTPAGTPAAQAQPSVATRDARGNALGGIRVPTHAVPTATNTGVNSGSGFCILFGSHEPFDAATLRTLYTDKADYVAKVRASAQANVAAGFMQQQDANAIIAEAEAFNF